MPSDNDEALKAKALLFDVRLRYNKQSVSDAYPWDWKYLDGTQESSKYFASAQDALEDLVRYKETGLGGRNAIPCYLSR